MIITQILNAASWHQRRADNKYLSDAERHRHDVIAFRLFKAAHIIDTGYVMGAA
ncbi:hypothetical protein [Nostoc phage NMeng1]|nr:hypothetical protein [Nostoc phage NMeng1]